MPPLRLVIEVDDQGTPVLRQFQNAGAAVGKTFAGEASAGLAKFGQTSSSILPFFQQLQNQSKKVDETTASLGRMTQASNTLATGIGGILKQGAGLAFGFAGLSTVSSALSTVVGSSNEFAKALANANSLLPGQVKLHEQLRNEILRLPPALGASKDLAGGLYAVLSAGVKPAESVAFLATSANLARAGLSTLDTATTALSKTIQVYGFETKDAARISDVLFQTVNLGQGTLEQFAGAFPNILVVAKSLGVSFEDASAALATLSNAFKSPSEAAIGLRSLFSQLIANADEFAIRGVNIRDVIEKNGLLGAIDKLRELTGGTADAVRKFIPDIEGQQAALTLLGAQYQKFIEVQGQLRDSQGSVAKAVIEQNKPVIASWTALGNALSTYIEATVRSSGFLQTALNKTTDYLQRHTKATLDAAEGGRTLALQGVKNRMAFEDFEPAVAKTTVTIAKGVEATKTFAEELKKEQNQLAATELAFKAFGVKSQKELEDLAKGAKENFLTIDRDSQVLPVRLREAWEKAKVAILRAYGELSADLKAIDERIRKDLSQTPLDIQEAFQRLKISTKESIRNGIIDDVNALNTVLKSSQADVQAVIKEIVELAPKVKRAGFAEIPASFKEAVGQLPELMRQAAEEAIKRGEAIAPDLKAKVDDVIRDNAFKTQTQLKLIGNKITDDYGQSGAASGEAFKAGFTKSNIPAVVQQVHADANARALSAYQQAAADFAAIDQKSFEQRRAQADDFATELTAAGRRGGQGFAEGIKAGTDAASTELRTIQRLSQQTLVGFTTKFGDTPRQLIEQLTQFRTTAANATQIATAQSAGGATLESFEALRKQIIDNAKDAEFLILQKLTQLGVDQFGRPLPGVPTSTVPAAAPPAVTTIITAPPTSFGAGGSGIGGSLFGNQGRVTEIQAEIAAIERELLLSDHLSPDREQSLLRELDYERNELAAAQRSAGLPSATVSSSPKVTPLTAPPLPAVKAPPGALGEDDYGLTGQTGGGSSVGQQAGTGPFSSGPFSGGPFSGGPFSGTGTTTTRGAVNVSVNVNGAVTRQGAQELMDHLAPALRELIRRGGLVA